MRVEELRDELLRIERVPVVCDYEDPKVGKVHHITHRQIRAEQLDALIAAAFEEGVQDTVDSLDLVQDAEAFARGVAQEREKKQIALNSIFHEMNFEQRLDFIVDDEWIRMGRPMPWADFKKAILRAAIDADDSGIPLEEIPLE